MTESTIKGSMSPQRVIGLTSKSDLYNEFIMLRDENSKSGPGLNGVQLLDAFNFFRMTPEEIAQNKKKKINPKDVNENQKFNFMSLYSSNSFVYNDKKKYVPSPFALDSKITYRSDECLNVKREMVKFSERYFVKALQDEVQEYVDYRWGNFKGVFIASELARGLLQYGINDGEWAENDKERFMYYGKEFINQTDYSLASKWNAIPSYDELQEYRALGPDGWLALLEYVPYLSMIDLTSSSGYPHWRPQSMSHVYDYAGTAYDDALIHDIMTLQARTQGGKTIDELIIDLLQFGNKKWKIRTVLASAWPVKPICATESYLWKLSDPPYTHYYKDGEIVQDRILKMVIAAKNDISLDVYNTDLSLADQTQDARGFGSLMDYDIEQYKKYASPIIHKYVSRGSSPLKRPYVLLNPRQILKFPRMIAPSGHPKVPKIESASVDAVHMAGLTYIYDVKMDAVQDIMKDYVLDKLIQIDDLQMLTPKFDLDIFSKIVRKKFGAIISSTKTNTFSKDGYVVPLKVTNGFIYREDNIKELDLLDGSNPSDGSYLGFIPTKIWGMFDHETGTRDDSPVVLTMSEEDMEWAKNKGLLTNYNVFIAEDGTKYYLASKPLQSLFGTLSSFGPKVPRSFIEMLHINLSHLKTWKDMIAFLRRQDSMLLLTKDYGFGKHDKLIKYLLELYGDD